MNKLVRISGKNNISKALNEFQTVFPNLIKKIDSPENYAEKLNKFAEVYYAYNNNQIFGLLVLYANNMESREAYISLIGIKKDFEHRGLGTYLLNEAVTVAKDRGMKHIKLEVDDYNVHAQRFYERNGFSVCGATENNSAYMMKEI